MHYSKLYNNYYCIIKMICIIVLFTGSLSKRLSTKDSINNNAKGT